MELHSTFILVGYQYFAPMELWPLAGVSCGEQVAHLIARVEPSPPTDVIHFSWLPIVRSYGAFSYCRLL
ncbi:MAG TPA: hypothetical protein VJ508_04995, partial [Saprospiraceae bacterium]|nr:hypothetical protein [Saprospiraceae bacterium]